MKEALEVIYAHPYWTTLWVLIVFASLNDALKSKNENQ